MRDTRQDEPDTLEAKQKAEARKAQPLGRMPPGEPLQKPRKGEPLGKLPEPDLLK